MYWLRCPLRMCWRTQVSELYPPGRSSEGSRQSGACPYVLNDPLGGVLQLRLPVGGRAVGPRAVVVRGTVHSADF